MKGWVVTGIVFDFCLLNFARPVNKAARCGDRSVEYDFGVIAVVGAAYAEMPKIVMTDMSEPDRSLK